MKTLIRIEDDEQVKAIIASRDEKREALKARLKWLEDASEKLQKESEEQADEYWKQLMARLKELDLIPKDYHRESSIKDGVLDVGDDAIMWLTEDEYMGKLMIERVKSDPHLAAMMAAGLKV